MEFVQFVQPRDVIGDGGGDTIMARWWNIVVALVNESVTEIVKFLLPAARDGEKWHGAQLHIP